VSAPASRHPLLSTLKDSSPRRVLLSPTEPRPQGWSHPAARPRYQPILRDSPVPRAPGPPAPAASAQPEGTLLPQQLLELQPRASPSPSFAQGLPNVTPEMTFNTYVSLGLKPSPLG